MLRLQTLLHLFGLATLLALAASFVLLAAPGDALAAGKACPGASRPAALNLRALPGTISFRTGNTRSDLVRLEKRHNNGRRADGWFPMGLTLAEFQMTLSLRVIIQPLGGNRYCAFPSVVTVNMGYPDFIIYIDRRYPRGTCESDAVRRHEKTHVAIYRDALDKYVPWVETRFKQALKRLQPVFLRSPDRAGDIVQERVRRKLEALLKKMHTAAGRANAEIDTPAQYDSIQKQCGNW